MMCKNIYCSEKMVLEQPITKVQSCLPMLQHVQKLIKMDHKPKCKS